MTNEQIPPRAKTTTPRAKHRFLPSEALMTLDILTDYVPGSQNYHVAFLLGVSRKHINRLRGRLEAAAAGDESACAEYDSRSTVMRTLYAYNRLSVSDPECLRDLFRDAFEWADPDHNILHGRGGKTKVLSGMDHDQQRQSTEQYTDYIEN